MALVSSKSSYADLNKASYNAQFYSYHSNLTQNLQEYFQFCSLSSTTISSTSSNSYDRSCSMTTLYDIDYVMNSTHYVNSIFSFQRVRGYCNPFYFFKDKVDNRSVIIILIIILIIYHHFLIHHYYYYKCVIIFLIVIMIIKMMITITTYISFPPYCSVHSFHQSISLKIIMSALRHYQVKF